MSISDVLAVIVPVAAMAGILLVVNFATGGRRTTRIVDADGISQAIRDADMSFTPGETLIGVDGTSALVMDQRNGAIAIAYVVGDRIAARSLRSGDALGVDWHEDSAGVTLRVRLADFGCPELRVRVSHEDVGHWRSNLAALTSTGAVA